MSADSSQIVRTTAELHQACDDISTQIKKFAKIANLKICTISLNDSMVFYKISDESLNDVLSAAIAMSTLFGQSFDVIHAEIDDLKEMLVARDAVIQFTVADTCGTLGPPLRSLFENFGEGLNKSWSDSFRACFIGF